MKIILNKFFIFLLFFLIFFSYYFSLKIKSNLGTVYYSHIFFITIFIYYLVFNIINRKFKIDYFFVFSLLILLSICISTSINRVDISNISFIPLISLIIFLMSFKYLSLAIKDKKEFYYIINIIYFFLFLHLIFNFIDIFDWILSNGFVFSNQSSFLRPLGLASSPVESTLYIITGYYVSELIQKKFFSQFIKYLFLTMMFLSLSRLGILIGSIIIFIKLLNYFFTKNYDKIEKKIYKYVIIIFLIIIIFLEYLYFYKGINILFFDRFNDLFNSNLNTQRINVYSNIILNGVHNLKSLLIGSGFQNISYFLYENTSDLTLVTSNPHSSYLSLFSNLGILGIVIFTSFFYYVINESLTLINNTNSIEIKKTIKSILSLQLIYLLVSLFDTVYVSIGINIIFSMLISIPYTLKNLNISNK